MHKLALCIFMVIILTAAVAAGCFASQADTASGASAVSGQGYPNPVSMLAFMCGLVGLLGIVRRRTISSSKIFL